MRCSVDDMSLVRVAFALSLALIAGCGAGPGGAVEGTSSHTPPPPPASTIDPITGQRREPAPERFAPTTSEHLCTASEDVIFACTLEGPPPQAVTSLCLKKGSPRQDPVVVGRERVDGRTDEPFAGQSSQMMISVLEVGKVPVSVEIEQRAGAGAFGAEKQTEPNKTPRYRRNLTVGKEGDAGAKSTHSACDPAQPITDNLEAMRVYKL
jgi:hypothetical protein